MKITIGWIILVAVLGALGYMLWSMWSPGVVEPIVIFTRARDSQGRRYSTARSFMAPLAKWGLFAIILWVVAQLSAFVLPDVAECQEPLVAAATVTVLPAPSTAVSAPATKPVRHSRPSYCGEPLTAARMPTVCGR